MPVYRITIFRICVTLNEESSNDGLMENFIFCAVFFLTLLFWHPHLRCSQLWLVLLLLQHHTKCSFKRSFKYMFLFSSSDFRDGSVLLTQLFLVYPAKTYLETLMIFKLVFEHLPTISYKSDIICWVEELYPIYLSLHSLQAILCFSR